MCVTIIAAIHVDDIIFFFRWTEDSRCDRCCDNKLNHPVPVKNLGELSMVWRLLLLAGPGDGTLT